MSAGPHNLHLVGSPQPPPEPSPEPPLAVLVMLAKEDDRVVVIDLSTHPCGQHILDDYAADAQLVSANFLKPDPAEGGPGLRPLTL